MRDGVQDGTFPGPILADEPVLVSIIELQRRISDLLPNNTTNIQRRQNITFIAISTPISIRRILGRLTSTGEQK